MLMWLWRRLAATVLLRPLTWEPPYAAGAALKKAKQNKTNKQKTLLEGSLLSPPVKTKASEPTLWPCPSPGPCLGWVGEGWFLPEESGNQGAITL